MSSPLIQKNDSTSEMPEKGTWHTIYMVAYINLKPKQSKTTVTQL